MSGRKLTGGERPQLSSPRSSPGAAHRQPADQQRRLADADRHPLAVLAAIADARVEGEVVADAADLLQRRRAVADQSRALHRRAHLAVLHAVGLGAGKHELAVGDVDLPAAEADGVEPVLHAGEQVGRGGVAGEHVGVGHPRHRDVGVALAPPVARRLDAHQPGALAVLHVADEHAVLDQRGGRGRRALVVDGDRAAAVGQGAVVEHGDARRGDALAHQAGEGGGALAVEVALESVADRLVQQDAGPAGAEHHVHHAGRGGLGLEVDQRDAQRLAGGGLPEAGVDQPEQAGAPAGAVVAALAAAVLLDMDHHVEPRHRADVGDEIALGPQDHHFLVRGGEGCRDLHDPGIEVAGEGVDLAQQRHLAGEGGVEHRVGVGIERAVGAGRGGGHRAAALAHGEAGGGDGAAQGVLVDGGGVGVARRLAADRAQPEALGGVVTGGAQSAVVERQHLGAAALEEQLAVVGAGGGLAHEAERGLLVELGLERTERGVGHGGSPVSGGAVGGPGRGSLPQQTFLSVAARYGKPHAGYNGIPGHAPASAARRHRRGM
ncbi:hypothetical protein OG2516_15109 [Oceanicola granulosus HTCC2516]|uniref:Uncharacterized protein n=1 Tax=Oceanicola granulosus (strain ATCC BAA-861 / DSM 15982 / KCTC 12143 / HTCC2516) TaxID=314256 RepID=Q2CAD8_OCEGH|nr:hypothetical protein OG2516_15109 [Oceanicola granulosus HTCC2516]